MYRVIALLLALILGTGVQTVAKVDAQAMVNAAKIEERLGTMTLEEKVGQLFFARSPGYDLPDWTQRYQPAGYLMFERDFMDKSWEQVVEYIDEAQAAAKIPLLIAADEEGGTVVRVSSNPALASARYASPQSVYWGGGIAAVRQDTQSKSQMLLGLGVNVNLAPVCDISTNPYDFIFDRAIGSPPEETAMVVAEIVKVMEEQGISSTLKHFPGYGNNVDTHTGISIDPRPYEQFQKEDFLPFKAAIDAGAPCVMVSHNIVVCMDGERPASLSPRVHEILRGELGFDGVIITDDLAMGAIQQYTGGQNPAVAALLAGNDLLASTDWEADFDALLAAVQDGTVPEERVDESVRRILKWKQDKNLI